MNRRIVLGTAICSLVRLPLHITASAFTDHVDATYRAGGRWFGGFSFEVALGRST